MAIVNSKALTASLATAISASAVAASGIALIGDKNKDTSLVTNEDISSLSNLEEISETSSISTKEISPTSVPAKSTPVTEEIKQQVPSALSESSLSTQQENPGIQAGSESQLSEQKTIPELDPATPSTVLADSEKKQLPILI